MPSLEQPLNQTQSRPDRASPDKPQRKRRLDVNPSLILNTEGRSKRRRTPSPLPDVQPEVDPKDVERAKHLGLSLYSKIMALRDSSGESMAEPFVKLPNKFPDYYETIKNPMSLEIIHQKLNAGTYHSLLDVCNDFYQMWNNAKRYNMKESTLFQWAKRMHQITRSFYGSHTAGQDASGESDDGASAPPQPPMPVATPAPARTAATSVSVSAAPSPSTAGPSTPAGDSVLPKPSGPGTGKKRGSYMKDGPTVYKLIKPCMRDIKAAKSSDGQERDIASIFLSLPDRRSFPDYYRMIKNPVSLDEIEHRMMARRYHTSDEFFVDVERMCDNAMLYNEDESEVWRDAKQIHGIVQHHRGLVKERLAQLKTGTPGAKLPAKTVTPVRHSSQQQQQQPAHATPSAPAIGLPQPMAHGMHAPQMGYVSHSPYPNVAYTQQQHQHQQHATPTPASSSSYLPPLPHGVVTEEVVATLDRYPVPEQQGWIQSLQPLALNIFRQMKDANEARKRGVPPPVVEARSAPAPDPGPLSPTIKVIDFAYSDAPPAAPSATGSPVVSTRLRDPPSAIRLRNMRGVATHAVAIASATSELELTAWVADSGDGKPEVTLRVNGAAAETPKLLYGQGGREKAGKDGKEGGDETPAGMRWVVPVSPARLEFKIEVVATKPGAGPETSAIFINRQF